MKIIHALPLLLITACSLAPEAIIPQDRTPETWRNAPADAVAKDELKTSDWSEFNSPQLSELITTALKNNTDLAAAMARVEESRASATIAGSGLFPHLETSGSVGHTRNTISGNTTNRDTTEVGATLSYEVDLWQKNSNLRSAADWQLKASEYDKRALEILVSSEVARLYTGYLSLDARLAVAQKNLKNQQEILNITAQRLKQGAISGLEEAQQRTTVASTRAAVATIQNNRDLFFDQLAQFVGVAPSNLKLAKPETLSTLQIKQVTLGTPWQLLEHRPDIAAAEARLRAANDDIGVARAQALPSLSLALNGSLAANPSTTLIGLAASFFAPIFEGGALQGAIEQSEATRDETVADYQGVLLNSFREVEDALTNYDAATKRRDALHEAADQAAKAASITRAQFNAGSIDYTTLVDIQNTQLQAEDSYLGAIQEQLAARIDLIRALGGMS